MSAETPQMTISESLVALTQNYAWTWDPRTQELLDRLPTAAHPLQAVRSLSDGELESFSNDVQFVADVHRAVGRLPHPPSEPDAEIAYFSMEFGVSETLRQYSGGLGILAGDHLKAASDLGVPLVAVGLFYREGFFHQTIDGTQQGEYYGRYEPAALGLSDTGSVVSVPMADREVLARVWLASIGRTKLYMLDTDVEGNTPDDRLITDRLYSGDKRHRIEQEMVMGVGGVLALRELGYSPSVYHLNEGHAGFLTLELLFAETSKGLSLDDALVEIRDRVVFTTHTPVPAGIDRFPIETVSAYLVPWADRLGTGLDDLLSRGHMEGDDSFNMAALCLGIARTSNGVSKLHGEVSRKMFAEVPGGPEITSVTNGVHARTWVAPALQDVLTETIGPDWGERGSDGWSKVDRISDTTIRSVRFKGRQELIQLLDERVDEGHCLRPDVLTVGFARRFASYKRADLLLRDMERIEALLADEETPVQFVFAGKAHPADIPGKEILSRVLRFAASDAARGRFVFAPGYDMGVARAMYSGCDVWLNNPIRPKEASGTSGEKSALNGGLNLSVLDGWWDECFDGRNGWSIPSSTAADQASRDIEEGSYLQDLLADEVVPLFYEDSDSPSARWLEMVRHDWKSLGPFVTAARMVAEYDQRIYRPTSD